MVHCAQHLKVGRSEFTCLKYPHLLAAGVALLVVLFAGKVLAHAAHRYEKQNERRVAGLFFPQKTTGSALQRLAFSMAHYLPIYGSSELGSYELQKRVKTKPGDTFITKPTGFVAFPIGRGGTTPLVMMQELASVGKLAHGHKVVIVLSPNWFSGPLNVGNYEGNAALLHTAGLLFGPFSPQLKQDAAKRLAKFPKPLAKSDLLRVENALLASDSPAPGMLAKLLQPVGKSWVFFLRLMDDFETVVQMRSSSFHLPHIPPTAPHRINWAEAEAEAETISNVEASWVGHDPGEGEPATSVEVPTNKPLQVRKKPSLVEFETSEVWGDYDLLLRVLHESGAQALILCVPHDGPVQDKNGVPFAVRKVYYDRVRSMAAKYGYPARTFEEHEYDGNFLIEHVSHLTDKGWLYLDQVIDAFYHDKL